MFGQMMHGVWQDFIRYVMLADVQVNRRPVPTDAEAPAGPRTDGGTPVDAGTPTGPRAADGAPVDAAPDDALLADDPGLRNVQYSSPDDPSVSGGSASMQAAARSQAEATGETPPARGNGSRAPAAATNTPVVKSEWDRTPRNAPCPCGSGKKYKMCHGRQ
jgi:preprotein translocase subunit SecA